MPTLPLIQPSFAAGELSPYLYGRVDLAKFHVGCRTLENMFVHPHGGASNRPGTRFAGAVADHAVRHRLIPFRFRSSPSGQNYALVFGHLTLQVVMLNNGVPGFVESSPGTIYTLATPYAASDLARLKYVQSADTMTLTHPAYAPRKLTRTGHAAWQLTAITFAPVTPAPTGLAASAGGTAVYCKVTAINDSTGEESLPSAEAGASSTSGTFSWTAVANCSTYNVYKKKGSLYGFVAQVGTPSWTDANFDPDIANTPPQQRNPFGYGRATGVTVSAGGSGYVSPTGSLYDGGTLISAVTFTLSAGAITAGSLSNANQKVSDNAYITIKDGAGSGAVLSPQWSVDGGGITYISGVTVVAGGSGYHAGAQVHSLYYGSMVDYGGYVFTPTVSAGAITSVAVTVIGGGDFYSPYDQAAMTFYVTDSTGTGAVVTPTLTADATSYPQCSTYYQQRQVFAGSTAQPQTLWYSVAGAFNNMSVAQPTRDSDAITRTLASREVNEVRHVVPVGSNLLLMTSGAEWRCWPGPSANALTPASCVTLPQTSFGCSNVPPISADGRLLFVQERGSRVRELQFDALQDQYQPRDASVLSQHLLYDTAAQYAIEEWAFAEEPFRVVWAVRSDGMLLGFTYMPEHDVFAWHRHITDGAVESVCSIPETDGVLLDAVYLIVRRTIGGQTRRYVERMAPRQFATVADAWFVDCGLSYSGSPVTSVSGLSHLEGKTVAILGDGSVVPSQVVSGGAVQLDGAYSKVVVGLPYTAVLETLNLELPQGTVQGQMKKIAQVTVRVKDTRGVEVGVNAGGLALTEMKQRSSELLGTTLQPYSGDRFVGIPAEWNRDGRVYLRQRYPLPCTVLAVVPEVAFGD